MPEIKTTRPLPVSRHFRLEQLAGGVYAAIATDEGAAISNAGIIDLGGRTLVFDTFMTPVAAKDLRTAAEALTGQPVTCVINSHYHNDHIRGNQVFSAETEIMASVRTCQLIETKGIEELRWDLENAPLQLQVREKELAETPDEARRQEVMFWVAYYRAISESLPSLKLRHPNWSFDEQVTFYGSRRMANLISYGPGHTEDDAILSLPDDGIVFASDLLFVNCHPYLPDGELQAWLEAIKKIEALEAQKIVPGHGPVGTPEDLGLMRFYITSVQSLAARAVKDGVSAEKAARSAIPASFKRWRFPSFFRSNVRYLVEQLQSPPAQPL
jgi:cyclase